MKDSLQYDATQLQRKFVPLARSANVKVKAKTVKYKLILLFTFSLHLTHEAV